VEIQHQAGMTAANTVNVKQRRLIDFNAVKGSTFMHRKISQISFGSKLQGSNAYVRPRLPP
jgi:hypothetical protein